MSSPRRRTTAQALAALVGALSPQALLTGRDFDRDHARAMFTRLIGPAVKWPVPVAT